MLGPCATLCCIEASDIDTSGFDCATIKGTCKFHSIKISPYNNPTMFTWKQACFCEIVLMLVGSHAKIESVLMHASWWMLSCSDDCEDILTP